MSRNFKHIIDIFLKICYYIANDIRFAFAVGGAEIVFGTARLQSDIIREAFL